MGFISYDSFKISPEHGDWLKLRDLVQSWIIHLYGGVMRWLPNPTNRSFHS